MENKDDYRKQPISSVQGQVLPVESFDCQGIFLTSYPTAVYVASFCEVLTLPTATADFWSLCLFKDSST